jgi:hypothetical protein
VYSETIPESPLLVVPEEKTSVPVDPDVPALTLMMRTIPLL